MNLKEELHDIMDSKNKYCYEFIVEMLKRKAEEGQSAWLVASDNIRYSDLERLKQEGLKIEYIDEDYSYKISW